MDTPYKTPSKKPRNSSKKQHYAWKEDEKELVKEGANKGWKETRIKNYYFKGIGPSKSQIKTFLEKLTTNGGSLAQSGLNNIPNFAQNNSVGNFHFFFY